MRLMGADPLDGDGGQIGHRLGRAIGGTGNAAPDALGKQGGFGGRIEERQPVLAREGGDLGPGIGGQSGLPQDQRDFCRVAPGALAR